MSLFDAWSTLRHGGNLLSPAALESLPKPFAPPHALATRLRGALVSLDVGHSSSETLGVLLDVVLEDCCGLTGWEKGSAIGGTQAEKLLDGTVLKPRRLWSSSDARLAVFATQAIHLGIGKGRRPVAHVIEYLRRSDSPLGLLTNGTEWRLIWADVDSLAWAEWTAERWLDGDQLSDELQVLRLVLSAPALEKGDGELSPLLTAIRDTRRGQASLSKELGERVRRAVETLLRGREPLLSPAWEEHAKGELYVAACHFVMRLVVTLFAEARELLPIDNPVYHQSYGLKGMLDQLDRLTPERRRSRHSAWPRLLALFRLLHGGSPHPGVTVPVYGGDLFRPGDEEGDGVQRALALLEALPEPPDDDVVHRILVLLTRTTQRVRDGSGWRSVAAPVDFTELTSEYIGILYEGLLDYELHRSGQQPVLFLNLGDQPALPLDRLEAMDDKALKALVEKAKVKKSASVGEDDEQEDNGDDDEDGAEKTEDEAVEEANEDDSSTQPEDADEAPDDVRAEVRGRAIAWGRRAAAVAKLVRKPKGKSAEATAFYEAALDAAARQLIADVKLPGELYLVRWGGTRKGAGTFYTRPQLTLPTLRRTLEPLLYAEGRQVCSPEELLALKVCDPAMGSGSFLVAALRVLTATVIESLHVHDRIRRVNGKTTVECELFAERDRIQPTEGFEERLEAIVRRAVVEHCLYGVDLDPLAVELARVALWVETLDKNLPFTFLDHKLRCGDALVGTWLDRFRDYPLLCFERQSPDKKYKGVNHQADVWHNALKARRSEAVSEQVDVLTGQLSLRGATTDEELKAAVERIRRLYRELRAVPAGRPDERARIWRTRIQTDSALTRVREAFDTWCALWFWPLGELEKLPLPRNLHAPGEAAQQVVRRIRAAKRFFHWELEFPDVFTEEGAGFDAVVGNPPWEIQKPSSLEFFSNHDPLYRTYGKQEALDAQAELFRVTPQVEFEWLDYNGEFKNRGNFVRNAAEPFGDGKVAGHGAGDITLAGGKQGPELHKVWRRSRAKFRTNCDPEHPYRHQGSADLNTYKMFVEVAHAMARLGGQIGIVVPGGLYSDKGTGPLRQLLLNSCAWRVLYAFQNERRFFRDAHHAQKQCVVVAEKGGTTANLEASFKLGIADSPEAEDIPAQLEADWSPVVVDSDTIRTFSPESLSLLEIRSSRDLGVLKTLYANGVLLGDEDPDGWSVRYSREFDMTNDSKLFVARDKADASGFTPDDYGRWSNAEGETLLPLYEGRMIGQFDFSEKGWVRGRGRGAVWRDIEWAEKKIEPQYLIHLETLRSSWTISWLAWNEGLSNQAAKREAPTRAKDPDTWARVSHAMQDRVAFMDVTASTNQRTMIATYLRDFPCGNSAPVLVGLNPLRAVDLTAALNSFSYDWVARARCSGLHLNWFVISESIVPDPTAMRLLGNLAVRLLAGCPSVVSGLLRSGVSPVLPALTNHERLRLRCILDAVVACLYGLDREMFCWVMKDCDHRVVDLSSKSFCRLLDSKGFWRTDKSIDPELRHSVLSVAAFDDLQAAIETSGVNREHGVKAFCSQNEGEGWMLPETLCVADLALTRTVKIDEYDEQSRTPQPVRSRMGPRFLDWQLSQTPEESWAECERNAHAIEQEASLTPSDSKPPGTAETKKTSAPSRDPKEKIKNPQQTTLPGFED